jgi:hypothetical protein
MASVGQLLQSLPNLRVIHLIRDPRGVALSRKHTEWSAGHSAADDIVQTAAIFCQDVAQDIHERQRLEKIFPGSFMQVMYEEFTNDPVYFTKNVYLFLDTILPSPVEQYMSQRTQNKSSTKWQDNLTFHEAHSIHEHCKELFDLVQDSRWVTS